MPITVNPISSSPTVSPVSSPPLFAPLEKPAIQTATVGGTTVDSFPFRDLTVEIVGKQISARLADGTTAVLAPIPGNPQWLRAWVTSGGVSGALNVRPGALFTNFQANDRSINGTPGFSQAAPFRDDDSRYAPKVPYTTRSFSFESIGLRLDLNGSGLRQTDQKVTANYGGYFSCDLKVQQGGPSAGLYTATAEFKGKGQGMYTLAVDFASRECTLYDARGNVVSKRTPTNRETVFSNNGSMATDSFDPCTPHTPGPLVLEPRAPRVIQPGQSWVDGHDVSAQLTAMRTEARNAGLREPDYFTTDMKPHWRGDPRR